MVLKHELSGGMEGDGCRLHALLPLLFLLSSLLLLTLPLLHFFLLLLSLSPQHEQRLLLLPLLLLLQLLELLAVRPQLRSKINDMRVALLLKAPTGAAAVNARSVAIGLNFPQRDGDHGLVRPASGRCRRNCRPDGIQPGLR